MMEAVRTSETSVDNHFTRQHNPEDNSEHHLQKYYTKITLHTADSVKALISRIAFMPLSGVLLYIKFNTNMSKDSNFNSNSDFIRVSSKLVL
jgi:hypothetical protein